MTACACSMSLLHSHNAMPCCSRSQVRSGRGVNLSERLGGISDSAVMIWRSASQFNNVDSKVNFIQSFALSKLEASSRLCRAPGKQSGVGVGLKDYSKTVARRKPVSEVQYRVQDAVDNGVVTEDGADNLARRTRERNRKQRNSERRRRVQILGTNGVVDLEEHLGLITNEEVISGDESRSDDRPGVAIQTVAPSGDEEGRMLLESSILRNSVSEIQGMQESIPSTQTESEFSSQQGQPQDLDLYPPSTQPARSAGLSEDIIEVEVAEQLPRVSFSSEINGQNALGKTVLEGPKSLAELPGGRRVVELVAAWDHLAGRLPPEFSRSSGSDLLLRALKLTVMALQHTSPDDSGRTPLCRALAVAHTLLDLGMDAEVISTGLLREAVDGALITYPMVEQSLGVNIAHLLSDCSRVRHIPSRVETLDDDSAKALRQFCLAFHDIRAVVVQLASQLDTMRHFHSLPRYRQQILALETMQIYAPLAHAIGTGSMALELEDLGFRVLFPDSYSYIENWLRGHWIDGSVVVDEFKQQLSARLEQDSELQSLVEEVNVLGRYKSRFSTMRKLLKDGRKPEEIYDVLGLRVILEPKADNDPTTERERGVQACYRAMEVATSMWKEVPGRLKDYIAKSKENGYESLHLAVHVSDQNERCPPMEIQIRTTEMDAAAVSGDASHSLYKGGMSDPEQIRNLKLIMMAAANAAASRFGEISGNAVGLEGGDGTNDGEDQMFKMFDKNQDGVISVEEFKDVMSELGADEGDAFELMQIVDLNTDGSVSAEEFGKFRHQIQISQNLAGVDREFSSQLGSKLQGSKEVETGEKSLSSGRLLKGDTEILTLNVEEELEPKTDTNMLSGLHRLGQPQEVNNQATISSSRVDEVNISEGFPDVAVQGFPEREMQNVGGSSSKVPNLAGKPKPNLMKPRPATVNLSSSTLQENRAPPAELGGELTKWPSSDNGALIGTVDTAKEVDDISAEFIIGHTLSQVRQNLASGNFAVARDLVVELSKQYPHSTEALLHHASVERKCGDLETASGLYAQAIDMFEFKADLGVEYVRALHAWASLEAEGGNPRRARYLFSESVEASGKGNLESSLRSAGVYGLHGWALLEKKCGNWSKARDLLDRAAELQPGNAVVHQSRAALEAVAHNYTAARVHFSRAVQAAPNDVRCWHAWAMFEASRGNLKKMRTLFRHALKVDSKNLHSLQAWAHQEGLVGTAESRSRARKLYQDCVDINPESVYCWQSWAILEQDSENFEGARLLFERGLDVNPESVPCLQAYAHLERKSGNLWAAKRLLSKALAVEPDNAAALMEMALVEELSGNDEAALALYKHAARVDKQKSSIKKRIFESRKRDFQESRSIPKSKFSGPRWRTKPGRTDGTKESSEISKTSIILLESQNKRTSPVTVTTLNDR